MESLYFTLADISVRASILDKAVQRQSHAYHYEHYTYVCISLNQGKGTVDSRQERDH